MERSYILKVVKLYTSKNKCVTNGRHIKKVDVSYYEPQYNHNVLHMFYKESLKDMMSYLGEGDVKDIVDGRVVQYKFTYYEQNEIYMILAMTGNTC